MLRLYSPKIFRENFNDWVLPMWIFENFEEVEKVVDMESGTYKFCLPVSIGDFAEQNVPACFSKQQEELKKFVELQKSQNHRQAFLLSDFQVKELSDICYSGTIGIFSKKGLTNYLNKETSINITFQNPIETYATKGISPRDLFPDIEMNYSNVVDLHCAFPIVHIHRQVKDLESCREMIAQAYLASQKLHKISEEYDGTDYSNYALFFVDKNCHIWLYEVVGANSFVKDAPIDKQKIREELDVVKSLATQNKILKK